MAKHAFLIIAHKNDKSFKTLLELLDHKDNDIFVHMDAKLDGYYISETEKIIKKSRIIHVERSSVQWGGYSMVNAELLLLEKATETGKYQYYHLISGEDLPLMKQSEMHKFFEKNKGKEFIDFYKKSTDCAERVRYWYPFQEKWGRKNWKITRLMVAMQKPFVRRNKDVDFYRGQQWFSITDDFARYIVSKKEWIEKIFRKTWCSDEVVMQTVLMGSPFKNSVYTDKRSAGSWKNTCCMRYIDWERGGPYIFRESDFDELIACGMCFARKFDAKVDSKIIDKLKRHFCA